MIPSCLFTRSPGCACTMRFLAALLALSMPAPSVAQNGPWKFDVLTLRNGRVLKGIVVEEKSTGILFRCIRQNPGQKTFVFSPATFHTNEIQSIDRLTKEERDHLAGRIQALKPNEDQRMSDLELKVVPWEGQANKGLCYESEMFVLTSDANDRIVRRAAVRLEDVFAAFSSHIPARRQNAQPTQIKLIGSLVEYRKLMNGGQQNILNLAFFDRSRNLVVCASDLKEIGADLEEMEKQYRKYEAELNKQERELLQFFGGEAKLPQRYRETLKQIRECRQQMNHNKQLNSAVFDRATSRLFQALYHEAFHAYLDNFVYSPADADVPRWLNEGLAQIFESAIVEAGELRVGHAELERLTRAKKAVRGMDAELVPLTDLLRSGPRQFLLGHGSDKQVPDRYYLTSWALAFYLTFQRQLLGTQRMDEYMLAGKRGTDPLEAFRLLIDQPLADFEKEFHLYILQLRPDGTINQMVRPN